MKKLTDHIAERSRSIDFTALGFYLPNPDPVLRARGGRIELYRELATDAHVGGCIRRRKSAVKALDWGLDRGRAPSRVAKAVEGVLADLDMERLIGEAMNAVLYGYQPMEVMWKKTGTLVVPGEIIGKPPEWFHFDNDSQLRFKTRDNPVQGEELPEKKFLLPRQDATYQNPYGFADLSMCFWPIVFKKGSVKFWLNFTEKFGSGFMVGKLPRNAKDEERVELLDSLEALIQDGVAVIPDDGSVALVELAGKTASAELYERLVMYCRSEVSIALTGTNQTTEANSNKASASAGLEVADDLRDGDAEIIAAAINQMIRWTVEANWGGADAPVFSFWDQKAQDVLQANRDKSNHESGANFTTTYFKRAYGYQDGDLVEPASAVAVPAVVATPPTVAFSEAAATLDLSDELTATVDIPMGDLIASIGDMVAAARDLPSLQKSLLAAYGNLDTDRLTEIMAAAFALAELKGMAAVQDEADA